MKFRRNLLSRLYRSPEPGDDGGGDTPVDTGTDPASPPADTGASTPPAEASTQSQGTLSERMGAAMFGQKSAAPTEAEQQEAAATGKTVQQLRDERGRFAGKAPDAKPAVDPTKPAAKPGEKPEHQMPEGLAPKAQERFQALVNTNKDLTARVAEYEPIVSQARELQQTFQQNGIKREQFDQAMQVVGLMNRGDLPGALAALDEQRKLISLALGRPVPGVNLLANHPDLIAEVENLQLTQERAEEIARTRETHAIQQQNGQRQQQEQRRQQDEQRQQQQEEQAYRNGQKAVDDLCKQLQSSDLDYARIEPMLIKEVQDGLLQGVPPARWPVLVQKTYNLIKQTATQTRGSMGATPPVLRPTGGEAPTAKPQNAFEAMWGKAKPAGA